MNKDNFDPQTGIVITILAGIFIFLTPYPINTLGMIFFPIGFLIFGPASFRHYKSNKLIDQNQRKKELAFNEKQIQIQECEHQFYWLLKRCSRINRSACLCVDSGGGKPNVRKYVDSDRLFTTMIYKPFEKNEDVIHIHKQIFDDVTIQKIYLDPTQNRKDSIFKPRSATFNNIDGLYLKLIDENYFPESGVVVISEFDEFYHILNLKFNSKYFKNDEMISNDHKGRKVCYFCNYEVCGKCEINCREKCSSEIIGEFYKD